MVNRAGSLGATLKRLARRLLSTRAERRHSLVGPARLWQLKRGFQIDFLKRVGLRPEHRVLDIGCGTLRGGLPIIEYLESGHYCGIELRWNVLSQGIKELRDTRLTDKNPRLIAMTDISDVALGTEFDFIWAFSVLIHMTDEILADTLQVVSSHLADEGACYANVNIGSRRDGQWRGFPLVWRDLGFYERICSRNGLTMLGVGSLKSLGHETGIDSQDRQLMLRIQRSKKR